jgi:hypothetical protein
VTFDPKFQETVQELLAPGMGTENVGPLLYTLARMTRSWRVMEVGLGYTTPFLAQALKDTAQDFASDIQAMRNPKDNRLRLGELMPEYYQQNYSAMVHAIDDYSIEGTSAPQVMEVLSRLDLDGIVKVHNGDFRGMSEKLDPSAFPLDLVWFDCGGLPEYVDFLEEYWPLINPDGGLLLLHFTYWEISKQLVMGSITNEIKRQQSKAGINAKFEVLTLVEPHKKRQGSVTMIRRLGSDSRLRDIEFKDDVQQMLGQETKPLRQL